MYFFRLDQIFTKHMSLRKKIDNYDDKKIIDLGQEQKKYTKILPYFLLNLPVSILFYFYYKRIARNLTAVVTMACHGIKMSCYAANCTNCIWLYCTVAACMLV